MLERSYNIYKVTSKVPVSGKSSLKTLHAVLSHLFEQTIEGWEKGKAYPNFKIIESAPNIILVATDKRLFEKEFSYAFGDKVNTVVVSLLKTVGIESCFSASDRVLVRGSLSMFERKRNQNGKNCKRVWVWSNYDGLIRDKGSFLKKLEEMTGIVPDPNEVFVEPFYIHKSMTPNNKIIDSAFDISFLGTIKEPEKVLRLEFSSVGQNKSYGFGGLSVKKVNNFA